ERPRYWVDHLRNPVLFARGVQSLRRAGARAFLEVGPKPMLLAMGQSCSDNDGLLWRGSLRPERSDWEQMLESLSALYGEGCPVSFPSLHEGADRRKVLLPTYPFQRKMHWIELTSAGWDRKGVRAAEVPRDERVHPLLGGLYASPAPL